MIDMAKEFGYHITAFHHAVEAYKIADLLRDNDICAAMWADWYGFKMEAYDAIKENIPLVHNARRLRDRPFRRPERHPAAEPGGGQGACRRPARGDQHQRRGRLGMAQPQPGEGARHPRQDRHASRRARWPTSCCGTAIRSAIYTRPERVWIDGALMYDMNDPKRRPVSDFELGQPGEGRREMIRRRRPASACLC